MFSWLFLFAQFVTSVATFAFSAETLSVLESGEFALLIVKQENELSVRPLQNFSKNLHTFRAISGSNPGDKLIEGDEKTPEGVYFVTQKIPKTQMTSLHGAAAFGLNYPNSYDRFMKKTGHGIWIHGVDSDNRMLKRFDTKGCVALGNGDVTDLGKYLKHDTPVIIVDTKEEAAEVSLEKETGPMVEEIREWAKAWASQEVDPYMDFYHDKFVGMKGKNKTEWRAYKAQLAKAYKKISVQLANILVVNHPKYRYAVFQQDYESNRFQAKGMKRLFLMKSEDAKYRIVREEGFRQQTGYIN